MSLCGDTDPLGVAGAECGCGRVMPASLPPAPKASSLAEGKRNDLHHTHHRHIDKPLLQSITTARTSQGHACFISRGIVLLCPLREELLCDVSLLVSC